jgi:hypothetical protein
MFLAEVNILDVVMLSNDMIQVTRCMSAPVELLADDLIFYIRRN